MACVLLAACGGGQRGAPGGDVPLVIGDPGAGDPGAEADLPGDGGPDALPPGCSPRALPVYVVAKDGALRRFRPEKGAFELVGVLDCGAVLATPFSMSVDRSGTAWVLYSDGTLYRASTEDASCQQVLFDGKLGFSRFGMGFAADAPNGTAETLSPARASPVARRPRGRTERPSRGGFQA